MNDQFRKLISVVRNAKDALLASWETENAFIDKQALTEEGLLSDPVGLTSLLLIVVAFRNETEIMSSEDKSRLSTITKVTLAKLSDWIKQDGFVATPVLDAEDSADFFKDGVGYLDSVTWVLSSSILARYAARRGLLDCDAETEAIIFDLIKQSLQQLLSSQRVDGTWGFSTDAQARSSLYFSYTASVSLADFFDYVIGEIQEVEQSNDEDDNFAYKDESLIAELSASLGKDVCEEVYAARKRLQNRILQDWLPLLPQLSECSNLDADVRKKLGMWEHQMDERFREQNINYYNLYYAYYLIDLIVMTATDQRYQELAQATEPQLQEVFIQLKAHYKDTLNPDEYHYYFESNDGANADSFLSSYLEQAVHSSRNQYMRASRTGDVFWDSRDSELDISWLHEERRTTDTVRRVLTRRNIRLSDPAIIPMALRINALYSYYICKQTDITVDRLFDAICENVSPVTRRSCVAGLWDSLDYSLMVTERSVEALVDYYDYLRKFESNAIVLPQNSSLPESQIVEQIPVKSEFEISFEKKIEDYLQSDAGRTLLGQVCAAQTVAPAAAAPVAFSAENIIDQLTQLSDSLADIKEPLNRTSENENERLLFYVMEVFRQLQSTALSQFIANHYVDTGKTSELACKHSNSLAEQFESLLLRFLNDADSGRNFLQLVYSHAVDSITQK